MFEFILGILGGVTTIIAKDLWLNRHDRYKKKLLKQMLEEQRYEWRSISTLSAVIGSNEEKTKELLIQIGARGSEKADGMWGLISRHPFPSHE